MINILISVPYISASSLEALSRHRKHIRLLIDSGAFTNWKQGKEVSVDEYMRFLDNFPLEPWGYFVLDKVGDPEGTWKNYEKMINSGYKPIPIFTRGAPIEHLERYYEHSDLVGIGGLVQTRGNKGYLKYFMEVVGSRKIHWLGFTRPEFLHQYRPYSADSSSWSAAIQYGFVWCYMGGGVWEKYHKYMGRERPPTRRMWKQIRSYGLDPKRLQYDDEWRNMGGGKSMIKLVGIASHARYMMDVEQRFGTKLFAAIGEPNDADEFVNAYLRDRHTIFADIKPGI